MKRGPGRLRIAAIALGAGILLAAAAGVALHRLPAMSAVFGNVSFAREQKSSVSEALLERVRDLYTLRTVEYVYKTVFPYDYMPETISLSDILAAMRVGVGTTRTLLTPAQQLYLRAYNLAVDSGLHATVDSFDFVVVTTTVTAGFDLSSLVTGNSQAPGAGTDDSSGDLGITVTSNGNGKPGSVLIRLPPVRVVRVATEDISHSNYPYPDVDLSPDSWRKISQFVADQVENSTVEQGLLDRAQKNALAFLKALFLGAGFDSVSFTG